MKEDFNQQLQLQYLFEKAVDTFPNNRAIHCDGLNLSYTELDSRANQLAHYLKDQNINPGSIVGILLERSLFCYISILALLKLGAIYVPLEVEYPDERINYILGDLQFQCLLTSSNQKLRTLQFPKTIVLDAVHSDIALYPTHRPILTDPVETNTCYIIYTSGSTGKPKGVEIAHASVCHYVTTASKAYEISSQDKIYQGFSLAFDASIEEIWMALANGAALIACTDKDTRSGVGLMEFFDRHQVSVLSTVPTLLSSLEYTENSLRLLILGGEPCAESLIHRWYSPGLKILNTYGPTEATVVATFTECIKDKPINIGKPLDGYEISILDANLKPVEPGETGELCIGGLGLAKGYVNLPEVTATKFIPHPKKDKARLYRTGDLAYMLANGDIQFVGRMDDQIKLRGFRIELNEIEQAIMSSNSVTQAVVSLHPANPSILVAYLLIDKNSTFDIINLQHFLHSKLPDYMMPNVFECVDAFPLLASGKVDRKALPAPTAPIVSKKYIAPSKPFEQEIARIWETALQTGPISVTADFFYDLGGHSLLAAKVISSLRKLKPFESLSILDLYKNPSIQQLAATLKRTEAKQKIQKTQALTQKYQAPDWQYYLCGAGQLLSCLIQYGFKTWQFLVVVLCYYWLTANQSLWSWESLSIFIGLSLLMPVVSLIILVSLKWLLLGRVKPGEYPLWSWFYFKWWLVRSLQLNLFPTKFIEGTPLIIHYYRLLGAKIGKNCYIDTNSICVADMFTMGDHSSLNTESRAMGYIVEDGWLKIGPVTIGSNCYLGSRSVLNIMSIMEDNSSLDDMSMLPSGSTIKQNQFFSGSPASESVMPPHHLNHRQRSNSEPKLAQMLNFSALFYFASVFVMMLHFASFIPSLFVINYFYDQGNLLIALGIGSPLAAITLMLVHLTVVCISKKLILGNPESGSYSIYSVYYLRQWIIMKLLDTDEVNVLGDSLFYPMILRLLGAKIGKKVELGESSQFIPDFLTIEQGGFAASAVAFSWPYVFKGTITYGSARIGKEAFVGNNSFLPQGTHLGNNCLLGCMTISPTDGRASQEESYWLGSPPVYLPTREMQHQFPDSLTFNPSKSLYALRMAVEFFRVILPSACSFIYLTSIFFILEYLITEHNLVLILTLLPIYSLSINLLLTMALIGLKFLLLGRIKPCIKPLWDIFIWKNDIREFSCNYFINQQVTRFLLGTPFVAFLYRAMGATIGKRVFIDTDHFAEFDLITVEDEVCINRETLVQTHLYEDRIFKLDSLLIKKSCNVGIGSVVLYNTVMDVNSTLGSFSLLMKGERLPANTNWAGNPAQVSTSAFATPLRQELPKKSSASYVKE